jgi:hypothetical protein
MLNEKTRAPVFAPMETYLGRCAQRSAERLDSHRQAIDQWSTALARGDHAEVDRLVRQSRLDRGWAAASGRLGAMLGQAVPTGAMDVSDRLPTNAWNPLPRWPKASPM